MKHGSREYKAMREWMRRRDFIDVSPSGFFHDVCSEDIDDAEQIFDEIRERLDALAISYRRAADEIRHEKMRVRYGP
jgi:hypothetical protein